MNNRDLQTEYTSLRYFKQQVIALGGDINTVAESTAYDLSSPPSPNNILSHETYCALLESAALNTNCPHFGLLLGQKNDISMLGDLGELTRQCLNLGDAASTFIRYFNMVSQGEFFRFEAAQTHSFFIREVFLSKPHFSVQAQDISLYEIVNITKSLCADDWQPAGVYFTHTPKNKQPYVEAFNCPVHFGQEFQAISIMNSDLTLPLIPPSVDNKEELEQAIAAIYSQNKSSVTEQTQKSIMLGIVSGDCGIKSVSKNLNMNTRMLHRKLQAENTSFTQLLDEIRKSFAENFLINTNVSVFNISQILAYQDSASLTRSFKRWHGMSPTKFRKEHLTD